MKLFDILEKNGFLIALGIFVIISVGGIIEIIPSFYENAQPANYAKPYTALQTAGRLVYRQEGCIECHSQLIRPFKIETDRYGRYSLSGEFAYDRPFLFGSRRIGPDLFRVGARRSIDWLEVHFVDASSTSPGTIMPDYTHLFTDSISETTTYADMYTNKVVFGVPYDKEGMPKLGSFEDMQAEMIAEAEELVLNRLKDEQVKESFANGDIKKVVALLAYLNARR